MRVLLPAALVLLTAILPGPSTRSVTAQRGAARDAAVPFKVGETLTYDVTWSSALVAGTATVTVREKRASASAAAYHIVAEGRPVPLLAKLYTLYYKMDTLLDSVTLLPQRGSLYSEEGSTHRLATTRFDRSTGRAFYEVRKDTTTRADFAVPPQVQDSLSALYVLRAMNFKIGQRISLPVADDGAVYALHVEPVAAERVSVPLGEVDAWNLKTSIVDEHGEPAATNAAVWISRDRRRLPLKLQAQLPVGSFAVNLRDAK